MAATTDTLNETRAGKYLTFELRGEIYGLEVLKVQEIIGIMSVTRVPRTPAFIRGVINLRGKVIPVIDLRLKFGMESRDDTERTCIIVVQPSAAATKMGLIVDEVSEVVNIEGGQIEDTPSFGAEVETDFILGLGKINQKVVMLLDADKVLSGGEISLVSQAAGEGE
jgi:purine-binding chemotaxis protein CheW